MAGLIVGALVILGAIGMMVLVIPSMFPGWKSANRSKAMKGFANFCIRYGHTDHFQSGLHHIAQLAPLPEIRIAAIQKMTGSTSFSWIAEHDTDESVRAAARVKQQEQEQLEKMKKQAKGKGKSTGLVLLSGGMPSGSRLSSTMPISSLVRAFLFASGDGKTVFNCPVAAGTFADTVGAPVTEIMGKVPLDVIAGTDVGKQIIQTGQFQEPMWTAMNNIAPNDTPLAQSGIYRTTVRPFENPITGESGVWVLFYKNV